MEENLLKLLCYYVVDESKVPFTETNLQQYLSKSKLNWKNTPIKKLVKALQEKGCFLRCSNVKFIPKTPQFFTSIPSIYKVHLTKNTSDKNSLITGDMPNIYLLELEKYLLSNNINLEVIHEY